MRDKRDPRSHASCAPAARVTRRHFVRTAGMSALAVTGGAAGVLSVEAAAPDPWREARAMVRGGALGRVNWAAARYTTNVAAPPSAACWTGRLQQLLAVLGDTGAPTRMTVLGRAAPTAILELAGGAIVYAAPGRGRADEPLAVVRGERATLLVHEHGVSLRVGVGAAGG